MEEELKDIHKAVATCTFCPKLCRYACPVADVENTEAATPWGKMTTMGLLEKHQLPWNEEHAKWAYKCVDCGLSTAVCEKDNPVSKTLIHYRQESFTRGVAPAAVYKLCEKFKKQGNPFGEKLLPKLKKLFPAKLTSRGDVVYFPGCHELHSAPRKILNTLKLFEKLGAESIGLYPEQVQCCGAPLRAAGDFEGFRDLAEINAHTFSDYKTIIFNDSGCLYTVKRIYEEMGLKVRAKLLHVSEFLLQLLDGANFRLKEQTLPQAAYHDPCTLGRGLGQYEAPRETLQLVSGVEPVEFSRNREHSYCCGGGGVYAEIYPQEAGRMTQNRIDEFKETKAKVLVTACSTCELFFKKQDKTLKVQSLVEYVSDAIR